MNEEGSILVITHKKDQNKYVFTFTLESNNKPISVSWFNEKVLDSKDLTMLPKNQPIAIQVHRVKGFVESVIINGKRYTKSKIPLSEGTQRHREYNSRRVYNSSQRKTRSAATYTQNKGIPSHIEKLERARAPYNFVPLNDVVVQISQQPPSRNRYHSNRLTGYLAVTVTTLTPLFIGTAHQSGNESLQRKEVFMASLDNQPFIPGSSFRGLIRQLLEIVSYAKFNMFDRDRRLFFRALADKTNLKDEYQNFMQGTQTSASECKAGSPKSEGGYLNYDDSNKQYYIVPAQKINGTSYEFLKNEKNHYLANFCYRLFDKSYLISSGSMHGKESIIKMWPPTIEGKEIPLSDNDIRDYVADTGRNIPVNILESAKHKRYVANVTNNECGGSVSFPNGVPVFYRELKNTSRIIFGHTPYFRVPYDYTIGDHVPSIIQESGVDLVDALFGVSGVSSALNSWVTRLFFEDLVLQPFNQNWKLCSECTPKILSAPKPTTIQHYLDQNGIKRINQRNNWNTPGTNIRGYKLYWHRNTPYEKHAANSWVEKDVGADGDRSHVKMRNVVNTGIKFSGRMRFENLTEFELGALLFVLRLPTGCAMKLGMGKPLGLGSVQVEVEHIIQQNPVQYYHTLTRNGAWELGETDVLPRAEKYRKSFEEEMIVAIHQQTDADDSPQNRSLWDEPRLSQLKKILTWRDYSNDENKAWNAVTRYLEIECKMDCVSCNSDNNTGKTDNRGKVNEYRTRCILPSVDRVIEEFEKR